MQVAVGMLGGLTFSIEDDTLLSSMFDVIPDSGDITVAQHIDREKLPKASNDQIKITVKAVNLKGNLYSTIVQAKSVSF